MTPFALLAASDAAAIRASSPGSTQTHTPTSPTTVRAIAIGARAANALAQSGGWAQPIAAFPQAPYLRVGDEIIWIGVRVRSLHPRMVVLDAPVPLRQPLCIECSTLAPWAPQTPQLDGAMRTRLIRQTIALHERIRAVAEPRGFGALLVGARPAFPLNLAAARVGRFVTALKDNDPEQTERSGGALLGVGTGLTPSGDDLVGAALFARRLIAASEADRLREARLAQRLVEQAAQRTHVISAALFADLAEGASYGLLHDVIDALLNTSLDTTLERVRALVAIGHSSGWDMLTGLIAALTAHAPARIRIGMDIDG